MENIRLNLIIQHKNTYRTTKNKKYHSAVKCEKLAYNTKQDNFRSVIKVNQVQMIYIYMNIKSFIQINKQQKIKSTNVLKYSYYYFSIKR